MTILPALVIGILAAILVGMVVASLLGMTRHDGLASEKKRGPVDAYLENLRLEMREAGIEGLSPIRVLFYFAVAGTAVGLVISLVLGYSIIGIAVGVLLTFVVLRGHYIGGRARKRRLQTIEQVAEAAREISDSCDVGVTPLDAVRAYAMRARENSVSAGLLGEENLVAVALMEAVDRIDRGMNQEESLRLSADDLGERFFSSVVETYLQNAAVDSRQLAAALRRVAVEIDNALLLRSERLTAVAQQVSSNRMMAGVIIGIVVVLVLMMPMAGDFYRTVPGQIFIIGMAGWWYLGSRVLVSGWQVDL